jgi:hypothetical protein
MYRLSVDQYHRMIEAGVLASGDKVELLEGLLVARPSRNPPHATVVTLIQSILSRLPREWLVRQQLPITAADSEPEPDFAIVTGPALRYLAAHPQPGDVALVIEVSDSSVAEDRDVQLRVDARARIPVYWVVNIPEGQVEVYTQPRGGRNPTYRQRRDHQREETIPLVLGGEDVGSIAVSDFLPLTPPRRDAKRR